MLNDSGKLRTKKAQKGRGERKIRRKERREGIEKK
jgi:hypothetical protein